MTYQQTSYLVLGAHELNVQCVIQESGLEVSKMVKPHGRLVLVSSRLTTLTPPAYLRRSLDGLEGIKSRDTLS